MIWIVYEFEGEKTLVPEHSIHYMVLHQDHSNTIHFKSGKAVTINKGPVICDNAKGLVRVLNTPLPPIDEREEVK